MRIKTNFANICLEKVQELSFFSPNLKTFPSLTVFKYLNDNQLDYSKLISLNASNEVAVNSFLRKKIQFLDIVKIIKKTVTNFKQKKPRNITDVFDIHKEASNISYNIIKNLSK